MATEEACPIAQLVDLAARLRAVRKAQRRFLRRWAEERSDRWLEALSTADRTGPPVRCFPSQRLQSNDLLDDQE